MSTRYFRAARAEVWTDGPVRPIPDCDRVAFVASWGPDAAVSRSLTTLVAELDDAGFPVVMVRASDDRSPLDWPDGAVRPHELLRRDNIGYDFGSWAVGLHRHRGLLGRRKVLLVNDSLVGPFSSLAPLLADFETSDSDVWGATRTMQFMPHLQSFFLGFSGGILLDRPLRAFWRALPIESEKLSIIDRYELGLSRVLFGESYRIGSMVEPELVVPEGENPTVIGWRRLLDAGFPFVKREIVLHPELAPAGATIGAELRSRFDQDPHDWL